MNKDRKVTFRLNERVYEKILRKTQMEGYTISKWLQNLIDFELKKDEVKIEEKPREETWSKVIISTLILVVIAIITLSVKPKNNRFIKRIEM